MSLFAHSKKPVLEFLRNLTPQVLLGSTARVLYEGLDFSRWDWSNWSSTLAFWGALVVAVYAFFANQALLTDSMFDYYDSRPSAIRSIRRLYRRTGNLRKASWAIAQREPTFFALAVLIILLCQVAWIVVVYAVAIAARNAFR